MDQTRVSVRFLGSGDAFASKGKFNTCFHVDYPPHNFLIDCGASSLIALKKNKIELNRIDTIFLTHFHGDHFGGLPFFILDAQLVQKRKNQLTIVGPKEVEKRVKELMEAMFRGSTSMQIDFDLNFVEAEDYVEFALGPLLLTYFPVIHSPESDPHGIKVKVGGKTLAYSGDTEWTDNLIELANGAHLFIVECYNFMTESGFHMSYKKLIENESRLMADKIMLTHLGDEMLGNMDQLKFEVCSDGQLIHF